MISVEHVVFLTSLLTTFMANVVAVTLAGYLRAKVSAWCGDDTSEQLGLATLNPLAHIDIVFFLFFAVFGIGFGRYPRINSDYISEPYKTLKFYFASFFNFLLYLFIAMITWTLLLAIFGESVVSLFGALVFSDVSVMHSYPNMHSMSLSLAFFGASVVYMSSRLALVTLVVNIFYLIAFPFITNFLEDGRYKYWLIFGASMVALLLLFDVLHGILVWLILVGGYSIVSMLGLS